MKIDIATTTSLNQAHNSNLRGNWGNELFVERCEVWSKPRACSVLSFLTFTFKMLYILRFRFHVSISSFWIVHFLLIKHNRKYQFSCQLSATAIINMFRYCIYFWVYSNSHTLILSHRHPFLYGSNACCLTPWFILCRHYSLLPFSFVFFIFSGLGIAECGYRTCSCGLLCLVTVVQAGSVKPSNCWSRCPQNFYIHRLELGWYFPDRKFALVAFSLGFEEI